MHRAGLNAANHATPHHPAASCVTHSPHASAATSASIPHLPDQIENKVPLPLAPLACTPRLSDAV